ncbi:hypothetical protein PAN31108_04042 [Pandoraea anhela]|uniref:Uncharacterized protein n=1 Tax=Pandoraea anhela TaxID=2508295 RepID=A0A5E4XS60_9BURK|nr:hypothetical protein PAN31108_04042 [Pandoraea anhela]
MGGLYQGIDEPPRSVTLCTRPGKAPRCRTLMSGPGNGLDYFEEVARI